MLSHLGICVSYTTLRAAQESIGKKTLELAKKVGDGFMLSADNLQRITSDHVEQRTYGPDKVHKYTALMAYQLRLTSETNGACELDRILAHRYSAGEISIDNITLDRQTQAAIAEQYMVSFSNALLDHAPNLRTLRSSPELERPVIRSPPANYKSIPLPLETIDYDPSSTEGTIRVLEDVCERQLERSSEDLSKYAILSVNDQGLAKTIRSAQVIRDMDRSSPYGRLQPFQLGIGMFHVSLNLSWLILATHRGSPKDPGSMGYWIEVLEKTRHQSAKPDFYSIRATFLQVFRGMILHCWRTELSFLLKPTGKTMSTLEPSELSAEDIKKLSARILRLYATPDYAPVAFNDQANKGKKRAFDEDSGDSQATEKRDEISGGMKRLMRDLCIFFEFEDAVHSGDVGRLENLFGLLALMFCGGGATNYTHEFLHFIQNLQLSWPEEFG